MRHNYPVKILLEDQPNTSFVGLYLGSETYKPTKASIWRDLINISLEATDVEALEMYRDDTVVIDPDPISTLDFDLSLEEKRFLLAQGRAAALKFLHAKGHVAKVEETEAIRASARAKVLAEEARYQRTTRKWVRRLWIGALLAMYSVLMWS